MGDTLPPLNPDAKALSDALLARIVAEIKSEGPLSFARYMAMALYEPELGYYRNTLKKFGGSGDFVTAPEISPLFSYSLANQCEEVLVACGGGDILEVGAGSGVMAADILSALSVKNALPQHYYILELSASLKAVQAQIIREKVPHFFNRVVWLTELPSVPIRGVVLANEVLDAMPVHQFTMQHGIKECVVDYQDGALVGVVSQKENPVLTAHIQKYGISFAEGYTSEVNLYLPGWMNSISDSLSVGAVILLDYGFPRNEYYHPDRSTGTIMCHHRHRSHVNPLIYPGVQDITAHVDFTAVAESAENSGFMIAGFTHQSSFLMNCGLLSFINDGIDETSRFLQNQQILQLTLPSEMGELFKVIGLTKNLEIPLMGFLEMNRVERL